VQDLKAKGESWAEWKAMQNMLGKQRERARCVLLISCLLAGNSQPFVQDER